MEELKQPELRLGSSRNRGEVEERVSVVWDLCGGEVLREGACGVLPTMLILSAQKAGLSKSRHPFLSTTFHLLIDLILSASTSTWGSCGLLS